MRTYGVWLYGDCVIRDLQISEGIETLWMVTFSMENVVAAWNNSGPQHSAPDTPESSM